MKKLVFVPVLVSYLFLILISSVFAEKEEDNVVSSYSMLPLVNPPCPCELTFPDCNACSLDNCHANGVCVAFREGKLTREYVMQQQKEIEELSNRLERLEKSPKASKLVALFAADTCPEGWSKTKWPYRKPVDNCTNENCKMVSVKELPGYIACEKN